MTPITQLVDLIRRHAKPGMHVAEIGCWEGATTVAYMPTIAQHGGHAWIVDHFSGNPTAAGPLFCPEQADAVFDRFSANVAGYANWMTVLRGPSADKIPEIPDGVLDVCTIDADHRYSEVKRDVTLCLPKLKPDGILCGDDLNTFEGVGAWSTAQLENDVAQLPSGQWVHAGVAQALHDLFGQGNIEQLGGSVWMLRR